MDFKEQVYSVLVVSASEKFNDSLSELLSGARYSPICFESSISSARRTLSEREYDLILINSPLPDENGIRFAIDMCDEKNTVVMIMIRPELYDSVLEKVSPYGIYLLQKPITKQTLSNRLEWLETTRERLRRIDKKTSSLEEKMAEIRLVNRAKWLLISEQKMPESDAHRYIEKQAMDRCVSKKRIAEEIIRTYS